MKCMCKGWQSKRPETIINTGLSDGARLMKIVIAFFIVFLSYNETTFGQTQFRGVKWYDVNANGVRDPGEPGLAGWTIILNPGCIKAVTNNNGDYSITATVPPGTVVTIYEEQRPGWKQTFPCPKHEIVVTDLSQVYVADFGNFRPAFIKGQKFNDLNCNGIKDTGEPGLAGWTIKLNNFQATVTDSDGNYCFCVPPGMYTVSEVQDPAWLQTFPVGGVWPVTLDSAETEDDVDFGNTQKIKISGVKYNDLNCNGMREANEPGLPGVTIVDHMACTTTVTNTNGEYCIWAAPGSDVIIGEAVPAKWHQTFPKPAIPGTYMIFGVNKTDTYTGYDFGNCLPGVIKGSKWEDLDCDGIRDPNEPGLPGWTIKVDDCYAAITDAAGNYCITVPPGRHTVCEMQMPGWQQTYPSTTCHTIDVVSCDTVLNVDFGNWKVSKIEGYKFFDLNCDGVWDMTNEPPLPGWTIGLSSGQTTVTDADGKYCFLVKPGTYEVCEAMQPGWFVTWPDDVCQTVTVGYCDTLSNVNFGNSKFSKLEGYKFHDLNCNGVWDVASEPALPGWTIRLSNGQSTVTDASGKYCFNVKPGAYTICEDVQLGWQQTFPAPQACHNVRVQPCDTITGLNFGNFKLSKLEGCKFWDANENCIIDVDDVKVPCWYIILRDVDGVEDTVKTDDTGKYCFYVKPGEYRICEVQLDFCTLKLPVSTWYDVIVDTCVVISNLDFLNQCEIDPTDAVRDLALVNGIPGDRRLIGNIASLSAHPNPADANITIEYALNNGGSVALELYNIIGRRVAVIEQGVRTPGRRQVDIDVSQLESGTYQLLFKVGRESQSATLVVEK